MTLGDQRAVIHRAMAAERDQRQRPRTVP
jgi:hypothetical protein